MKKLAGLLFALVVAVGVLGILNESSHLNESSSSDFTSSMLAWRAQTLIDQAALYTKAGSFEDALRVLEEVRPMCSADDQAELDSLVATLKEKVEEKKNRAYDFEVSHSTESSFGDYTKIKFEVKIFNLSRSESMPISWLDTVSYTINGNEHSLHGPDDSDGNRIETSIPPGSFKKVYYSDFHKGSLPGSFRFSYSCGASGWVRRKR